MIKTNYLSTCVPTHKVIQNKNKYIAHNKMYIAMCNRIQFMCRYGRDEVSIAHVFMLFGKIRPGADTGWGK